MEGFKSFKKVQCFKEGGSVKYESRKEHKEEMSADVGQDKKIIKKAFKMHDAQEHKGEKTDLSKLKKGGRAKKEKGTVKKFCGGGNAYKEGGSVTNVYEAKKKSGDISNIEKVKDIKPGKAAAPSKASVKPNFEGSDVEKEKSKPSGHEDPYIKSKQSGKKAAAPSGAKGPDAYKKGGKVKKMADGQLTAPMSGTQQAAMQGALPGGQGMGSANDMERRRMMERAKNAMKYLGPSQQSEFVNQGGMSPTGVSQAAPAGSTIPGGMKKGGKAKKDCK